ncbi:MAG: hypothetical protein U0324_24580 [Polyangiales bacterium]
MTPSLRIIVAVLVLASAVLGADLASAQEPTTRTSLTLRAAPDDLPRYVCVLEERPPADGERVLLEGWVNALDGARGCGEARANGAGSATAAPAPCPQLLDPHYGPPVNDESGERGVAVRALRALVRSPWALPLGDNCRARVRATASAGSTPAGGGGRVPRTIITCAEIERRDGDGGRVLLFDAHVPLQRLDGRYLTLSGNQLTLEHGHARHRDGALTFRGGHYLPIEGVRLEGREVPVDLQPVCVARVVPLPPEALARGVVRGVALSTGRELAGGHFDGTLGDDALVALPTQPTNDLRPQELTVSLSRGGVLLGEWSARWVAPMPPPDLPLRVTTLAFSWHSDEYPQDVVCPEASLSAFNLACEKPRATVGTAQDARGLVCRYTCRVASAEADHEVRLPLRVRFHSTVTQDEWEDTVQVLEQHLSASPDPQTRHLLADVRRWPEDLRTSDELDEVTVLGEADQRYHIYPRVGALDYWLVTVPGARQGTPLRLQPFGSHNFSVARPVTVDHGVVEVPNPADRVTPIRLGVRLGGEAMGFLDRGGLAWSLGVHAQATLRFVHPRLRVSGRFIPIDLSLHYLAGPIPYQPVRSEDYPRNGGSASVWYNRMGVQLAVLFPINTWQIHVGPSMTWLAAWPMLADGVDLGELFDYLSVGATARYNIDRHWSIELDAGWQWLPVPRFDAQDFRGQPLYTVEWTSGVDVRGALRFWF